MRNYMKRILLTAILATIYLFSCFGQNNPKQWLNLNYADDDQVYHHLDIYLPEMDKLLIRPSLSSTAVPGLAIT